MVASVIFVIGAFILAFARSFPIMLIGRIVIGLGVGLASMVVPVYISEIAPK